MTCYICEKQAKYIYDDLKAHTQYNKERIFYFNFCEEHNFIHYQCNCNTFINNDIYIHDKQEIIELALTFHHSEENFINNKYVYKNKINTLLSNSIKNFLIKMNDIHLKLYFETLKKIREVIKIPSSHTKVITLFNELKNKYGNKSYAFEITRHYDINIFYNSVNNTFIIGRPLINHDYFCNGCHIYYDSAGLCENCNNFTKATNNLNNYLELKTKELINLTNTLIISILPYKELVAIIINYMFSELSE